MLKRKGVWKGLFYTGLAASLAIMSPMSVDAAGGTTQTVTEDSYVAENALGTVYGSDGAFQMSYGGQKAVTTRIPYLKFVVPNDGSAGSFTSVMLKMKIKTTNLAAQSGGKWATDEVAIAYGVSNDWSENSITYGNAPARNTEIAREYLPSALAVNDWVTIDITDYVNTKQAGETVSVAVMMEETAAMSFYSTENGDSSNAPYVEFISDSKKAVLLEDMSVRSDNATTDSVTRIAAIGRNAYARRNGFVKFSTDGIDLSNVTKATLKMKVAMTSNGNTELKAYTTSNNWSENAIPKYENMPVAEKHLDTQIVYNPSSQGKTIEFDVTDAFANISNSTASFQILCDRPNDNSALSNVVQFYAKEATESAAVAPVLELTTSSRVTDENAIQAENANVRLETAATEGVFIRVNSGALSMDKNVSPLTDAKFKEAAGFISGNFVSLESVTKPGYYLVKDELNGKFELRQNDGSSTFKENATFKKVAGLSDNVGVSYQLYSNGMYLANLNGTLNVSGGETSQEKKIATFYIRSEGNVYFSDEFEGSSLNTNAWACNYPWGSSHNYSAVLSSSQVSVADSKLTLTATRVSDGNWIKNHNGDTGYMDTMGGDNVWRKYSHLSGSVYLPFSKYPLNANCYIEGSFKMPNKTGFWPAFWLNGNYGWPPEIDIFEYLSNDPGKIYVGIHKNNPAYTYGDEGHGWWITKWSSFFTQEFHKYAIDWSDSYINYYIDDVLVRSVEDQGIVDNQQNMYLIINLGVGGWATEPTDAVGENTTYQCDYVHIYKYD